MPPLKSSTTRKSGLRTVSNGLGDSNPLLHRVSASERRPPKARGCWRESIDLWRKPRPPARHQRLRRKGALEVVLLGGPVPTPLLCDWLDDRAVPLGAAASGRTCEARHRAPLRLTALDRAVQDDARGAIAQVAIGVLPSQAVMTARPLEKRAAGSSLRARTAAPARSPSSTRRRRSGSAAARARRPRVTRSASPSREIQRPSAFSTATLPSRTRTRSASSWSRTSNCVPRCRTMPSGVRTWTSPSRAAGPRRRTKRRDRASTPAPASSTTLDPRSIFTDVPLPIGKRRQAAGRRFEAIAGEKLAHQAGSPFCGAERPRVTMHRSHDGLQRGDASRRETAARAGASTFRNYTAGHSSTTATIAAPLMTRPGTATADAR